MIQGNYTSDNIITNEGLDSIRFRPTQFINTRDNAGQVHTAKEVLDNSNDELAQLNNGILTTVLFRDRVHHRYQLLIADTGRGIPVESEAFLRSLTVMNTSGKYSGGAYRGSSGLFGVGGKVPAALSTRFKAISRTRTGTGLLLLNDSQTKSHIVQFTPNDKTGVSIIYEPDPQFFRDISYFMETGYLDIISLFQLWGVFSNIRYIFKIVDTPIDESFWDMLIIDSTAMLDIYTNPTYNPLGCETVYDSELVDSQSYLIEYFNTELPITWSVEFDKPYRDSTDRISYIIKLFTTKKLAYGRIGLINNVIPKNQDGSTHVSVFFKVFNQKLAQYIEIPELQAFFISTGYKVPCFSALSVKCDNIELGGTTKDSFIDSVFGKLYEAELNLSMDQINPEAWKQLVSLFLDDLQDKYNRYHNKTLSAKNANKLTLELNFPNNFSPCKIVGPNAELFIVEGQSAGSISVGRDATFQAIYCTRGKPENIITCLANLKQSKSDIKKNKMYQDLIKIIGLDEYNDPELLKLNYGKIIFTMDADPDGAHIVSLHTGDTYALNSKLIEKGFIWIATPPLYTMKIGKGKQKKYLRDHVALIDSKIDLIYSTSIKVDIKSEFGDTYPLNASTFREFCYMTMEFGLKLEHSAKILGIPILILERLVYGLKHLLPRVNIDGLSEHFGVSLVNWFVRLNYYPEKQILVLSVDDNDYPISLMDLDNEIRNVLYPYVKKYKLDNWFPVITSKLDSSSTIKNRLCTIAQVYLLFKSLDESTLTIDRIKGLGRLTEEDVITTITNPQTRSLYRISEVGDIKTICDIMGDDSTGRKALLTADGLVTSFY